MSSTLRAPAACAPADERALRREFQLSGFDSSDKNEQPDFPGESSRLFASNSNAHDTSNPPVIFTKRATSIVATGTEIYPHPTVTDTLDYEGELGIIVGKEGINIKMADAWKHVWGAVVINDVSSSALRDPARADDV